MMKTLLKVGSVIQIARRGALRPSRNIPYFGLYRKEGETVQQDELLVSQRNYNYHPGANVYHIFDRGCHLLKADCDGVVMITREKAEVNMEDPLMRLQYKYKNPDNLYKLTYNVVSLKMSQRFKLIDEV